MSEIVRVMANGRDYFIPGIWLAGFCQANKCGTDDAVRHWIWQAGLEEEES